MKIWKRRKKKTHAAGWCIQTTGIVIVRPCRKKLLNVPKSKESFVFDQIPMDFVAVSRTRRYESRLCLTCTDDPMTISRCDPIFFFLFSLYTFDTIRRARRSVIFVAGNLKTIRFVRRHRCETATQRCHWRSGVEFSTQTTNPVTTFVRNIN